MLGVNYQPMEAEWEPRNAQAPTKPLPVAGGDPLNSVSAPSSSNSKSTYAVEKNLDLDDLDVLLSDEEINESEPKDRNNGIGELLDEVREGVGRDGRKGKAVLETVVGIEKEEMGHVLGESEGKKPPRVTPKVVAAKAIGGNNDEERMRASSFGDVGVEDRYRASERIITSQGAPEWILRCGKGASVKKISGGVSDWVEILKPSSCHPAFNNKLSMEKVFSRPYATRQGNEGQWDSFPLVSKYHEIDPIVLKGIANFPEYGTDNANAECVSDLYRHVLVNTDLVQNIPTAELQKMCEAMQTLVQDRNKQLLHQLEVREDLKSEKEDNLEHIRYQLRHFFSSYSKKKVKSASLLTPKSPNRSAQWNISETNANISETNASQGAEA